MENKNNINTLSNDNFNKFENTHNYCTKKQCIYNPKEQTIPIDNTSKCLANFCIGCGVNMGDCNSRQYCYKIYCPYEE